MALVTSFPEKERRVRAWRGLTYQNKKKAKYEREENPNDLCH